MVSPNAMSDSEEISDSPPNSPSHSSESDGSTCSGIGGPEDAQRAPVRCQWDGCSEWFGQLEALASHVSSSHAVPASTGLFYCGWRGCSRGERGFNARYKMLVHVRTHTNEKPHHCFQCDKSFSRAENLKIHARSHTGERPYVCPVTGCGKAYSNSSDRFKHTRTHSVDKPYVCKVPGCPKRYTDPSSLRKHVKTYRHYPPSPVEKSFKTDSGRMDWKPSSPPSPNLGPSVDYLQPPTTLVFVNSSSTQPRDTPELSNCKSTPSPPRSPNSAATWPSTTGFIRWWSPLPPTSPDPAYYPCFAEQDTPLDLTCPIKLHN